MSSKENAAIHQLFERLECRYALRVLWALRDGHPQTFRLLQDSVGGITPNTLNTRIKELREAGLLDHGADGYTVTAAGADLLQCSSHGLLRRWMRLSAARLQLQCRSQLRSHLVLQRRQKQFEPTPFFSAQSLLALLLMLVLLLAQVRISPPLLLPIATAKSPTAFSMLYPRSPRAKNAVKLKSQLSSAKVISSREHDIESSVTCPNSACISLMKRRSDG